MKMVPIRLVIFALALFYLPSAFAQDSDRYIAPLLTFMDDEPDRAVADSVGLQFGIGRNLTDHLSIEGILGYTAAEGYVDPGEFYPDQKIIDLSGNLVAYLNRDWRIAPYLLVGVGYLGSNLSFGGNDHSLSNTLGVGFNWKISDGRYSIRTEARTRGSKGTRVVDGSEQSLKDTIVSLGFQYNFGRKPVQDDNADTDGDGVLDIWDDCPNTPRGEQVSANGCKLRDIDTDADGDRVPDKDDQCPNTRYGDAVDPRGCSLDSDGDGVISGQDRCPASRPGAQVDKYGCERDDDKDGVLNQFDSCPNTRPAVDVDVNGCEIESVIQLPGVNFESGADRLLPGAEALLENIAATLKKFPNMKVEVAGHTDSVGLDDANFGLSERRAITVRDYLINLGVTENRLTATGYGETQPITDNDTPEGRAINRRVELRIISR